MKTFDKYKDPSYISVLLKNNLYVKTISKKLPMDGFHYNKISKFTEKVFNNCKYGKFKYDFSFPQIRKLVCKKNLSLIPLTKKDFLYTFKLLNKFKFIV